MGLRRLPRQLAGLGALVAVVLICGEPLQALFASPAGAQVQGQILGGTPPHPTLTLTSPPPSGSGPVVLTTPSPTFAGTVVPGNQAGTGAIDPMKVVITSSAGHPGATLSIPAARSASGNVWTFSGTPVLPLTYNGVYQATVTATETDTGLLGNTTTGTTTDTVSFAEDVAPTAPQGVTAIVTSTNPSSPVVSVSWSPNPEPDILGYGVLRSQGSGTLQQIGTTTGTTYRDTTARPGATYTYAVVALRSGDGPGQSLLSPATSAGSVSLPGLPPSTTATTAGRTTSTTLAPASSASLSGQVSSAIARSGIPPAAGASGSGTSATAPAASTGSGGGSSTSTTTAAASATGAPTQGGFSEVLPYGKKAPAHTPTVAAGPVREPGPASKGSSGARARMLATIALGMIFLVVATLVIRLVHRASQH